MGPSRGGIEPAGKYLGDFCDEAANDGLGFCSNVKVLTIYDDESEYKYNTMQSTLLDLPCPKLLRNQRRLNLLDFLAGTAGPFYSPLLEKFFED